MPNADLVQERLHAVGASTIDGQGQYYDRLVVKVLLKPVERWHLFTARCAPGGPKVEHDDLARECVEGGFLTVHGLEHKLREGLGLAEPNRRFGSARETGEREPQQDDQTEPKAHDNFRLFEERGMTQQARDGRSMWGAHFATDPAPLMAQINASIGFDKRLYMQDIAGSKAHARMLATVGLLSEAERNAILAGLERIRGEIESGAFAFSVELEDIHLNIEARLTELIGDAGRRLHTARSRNDQVATDLKLWVRDALDRADYHLRELQGVLLDLAEAHAATVLPGFTHLQAAQPVTLGHHLMAYVEMLGRDRSRFADGRRRLNECPLGAAALAGTSFAIDRKMTAAELGFDRPAANSIDAVSDRDFALDYLAGAAICAIHLSRLAEELVLWSTPQFGFVAMPEAFTSGSSIMPQKRNPDAAELVRGKSGRIVGDLQALLIVLKGLPLAYSKDLQEDKEGVFDAADSLELCLAATAAMLRGIKLFPERMRAAAAVGYTTATDLADWLVRSKGVPFREAHGVAARAVRLAENRGCSLEELELAELQAIDARIEPDAREVLAVDRSVASRRSLGGTAPERVLEAVAAARARWI